MSEQGCLTCRWAEWKKTANGRLHPSGTGRCTFEWEPPPLPKSRYFMGWGRSMLVPDGGSIERKFPHSDCPTWAAIVIIPEPA